MTATRQALLRRLVEAFASEPDFVDLLPLALVLRDLAVVLALLPRADDAPDLEALFFSPLSPPPQRTWLTIPVRLLCKK
ncbi:hypothetical protein, partial [Aurantimonas coralicida]|uniref:hypothetical protein n=1 Tax=Aurantimonas coralicida TaxID=182270 RepID=UPI0035192680